MNETSAFQLPLAAAMRHALAHVTPDKDRPVAATAELKTLRQALDLPLSESGVDAVQVVNELAEAVRRGIIDSAGGRFYGWVIGGSLPAALAADWMTSAWDQNAGLYVCSPAAAVVEETAGRWLKELLHLPDAASFALVTGCQMAHVTCLAAARHALLARAGWDVEQEGLAGAPVIRILTGVEKHATVNRAVRLLGLGEKRITGLPVDAKGGLLKEALAKALAESLGGPTLVVLQAGDVNTGACDDFAELIPLAKKYGAWVHIDGAFGLWAAASEKLRHLVRGVELADSWATDGHKWLNVPYDCGYAFVADTEAHRAAFAQHAAYLTHSDAVRNQLDWNPEFSRRARGFATYAAIRQLGRAGVAEMIERDCECAHALAMRMGALPGAEVLWEPTINQGLVRFLYPANDASEADHDAFTDRVMAAILATGEAFFSGTTWRGRRAMRVSVSNWQTSTEDVERVVRCVAGVLKSARGQS
jgi:glutamate/tyrosine decarboxylase-like PLP-dependent enzyme